MLKTMKMQFFSENCVIKQRLEYELGRSHLNIDPQRRGAEAQRQRREKQHTGKNLIFSASPLRPLRLCGKALRSLQSRVPDLPAPH
jgi:hypothetical protein